MQVAVGRKFIFRRLSSQSDNGQKVETARRHTHTTPHSEAAAREDRYWSEFANPSCVFRIFISASAVWWLSAPSLLYSRTLCARVTPRRMHIGHPSIRTCARPGTVWIFAANAMHIVPLFTLLFRSWLFIERATTAAIYNKQLSKISPLSCAPYDSSSIIVLNTTDNLT